MLGVFLARCWASSTSDRAASQLLEYRCLGTGEGQPDGQVTGGLSTPLHHPCPFVNGGGSAWVLMSIARARGEHTGRDSEASSTTAFSQGSAAMRTNPARRKARIVELIGFLDISQARDGEIILMEFQCWRSLGSGSRAEPRASQRPATPEAASHTSGLGGVGSGRRRRCAPHQLPARCRSRQVERQILSVAKSPIA